MHAMLSTWAPPQERSKMVTAVYAGMLQHTHHLVLYSTRLYFFGGREFPAAPLGGILYPSLSVFSLLCPSLPSAPLISRPLPFLHTLRSRPFSLPPLMVRAEARGPEGR